MEDWKYYGTYSGCPQGGIISPILANIYLNELDKFCLLYTSRSAKGGEQSMAYVPVPKDLNKIKTKLALNLTKRQLICFSLAAEMCIRDRAGR